MNSTTPNNDGDGVREWVIFMTPMLAKRAKSNCGVQTQILEHMSSLESKFSVNPARRC